MLSILVKIIYFAIVSIVSGHYYSSRLVETKGRYMKRKEMLLCGLIFATHLTLIVPVKDIWLVILEGTQIIVEFLLIVALISGKLGKKLMVYVEMNVILGIGAITGYGFIMLIDSSDEVMFYVVAMTIAVVLCNSRIMFIKKSSEPDNISGRELTVTMALMLLCVMYVMAVALYEISEKVHILLLYVMFAIITILTWTIYYVNERIQNKEEAVIKYYVYNTIEQNKKALEEQLQYDEKAYVESYSWLVENMERIYEDMLKTVNDTDKNVRVLPVNKMLMEKRKLADKSGIIIEYEEMKYLPENISVYDMVSILANLLDNAIRAVSSLAAYDKRICADININENEFYIRVSNAFASNETFLFDEDGNYITTKLDKKGHGLGLKSVKNMVTKYGLKLNIKNDDGEFVVTITG